MIQIDKETKEKRNAEYNEKIKNDPSDKNRNEKMNSDNKKNKKQNNWYLDYITF